MDNKKSFLDNSQQFTLVVWMLVAVFVYGILVGYSGKGLMNAASDHQRDTGFGRFGDVARSLETTH